MAPTPARSEQSAQQTLDSRLSSLETLEEERNQVYGREIKELKRIVEEHRKDAELLRLRLERSSLIDTLIGAAIPIALSAIGILISIVSLWLVTRPSV